jgi:hypothetical protein
MVRAEDQISDLGWSIAYTAIGFVRWNAKDPRLYPGTTASYDL